MTRQYYILTLDPRAGEVFEFIRHYKLACEVHLNRTRFWVPLGTLHTEFMLRWFHCCSLVVDNEDYALGTPRY
jgi:hypothetical protein